MRGPQVDVGELYDQALATNSDIVEFLPVLVDEVRQRPGAVVVELGVREGNSTVALLYAVEKTEGTLWSCDLNPPGGLADALLGHPRWTFEQGSSINLPLIARAPWSIDVLFIDTSHTYAQTKAELHLWAPRVADGGVVLLHDTALNDPCLTDDSLLSSVIPFPVRAAAKEFLRYKDAEWSWEELPGQYGLGMMRHV